jgi:hypothetical protein
MGVKLEVNFPNMDKGTELDVGGILVKNGGSVELTDEQEAFFVSKYRKTPKEWAGEGEYVKVSGSGKFSPKQVEDMYAGVTGTPLQEEAKEEAAAAEEGSGN